MKTTSKPSPLASIRKKLLGFHNVESKPSTFKKSSFKLHRNEDDEENSIKAIEECAEEAVEAKTEAAAETPQRQGRPLRSIAAVAKKLQQEMGATGAANPVPEPPAPSKVKGSNPGVL